jgi:hypothetical protein
MIHPDFPGGPPTMFICGNDDDVKKTRQYPHKVWLGNNRQGGIEGARLLEPLAFPWTMHYFSHNEVDTFY